jgi:hypothetical protein
VNNLILLAGALLIAVSIAFSQRYETTVVSGSPLLLLRTDRWTGHILQCESLPSNHGPEIPTFLFQRCQVIPGSEG